MNRSRRLLAAAVTVAAVLGALTLASAASLPVSPGAMTSTTAPRPCDNGATATAPAGSGPTYTAVRLTVPVNCVSRSVQVTLVDGGGVAHSSVSTVMASVTQDVSVSNYTAAAGLTVVATVDGWSLGTNWSYTAPLPKASCRITRGPVGATCDVEVTRRIGILDYVFYDVVVISSSPTWATWEVTLNLTHTFYAPQPTSLGNSWATNDDGNVERASCGSGALAVRGPGTSNGNSFRNVTDGTDREFTLVVDPPLTANLLQGCS